MKINEQGVLITKRFFFAIELLIKQKKIRGVHTFTSKYNINYWNLMTVKKEPEKHILKPEWLSYLVTDYNISAYYLLSGCGSVFQEDLSLCD